MIPGDVIRVKRYVVVDVTPDGDITITDAIDFADHGAVIQLAAGIYSEGTALDPEGKALTLRGAVADDGTLLSSISGNGTHRVIQCQSGEE